MDDQNDDIPASAAYGVDEVDAKALTKGPRPLLEARRLFRDVPHAERKYIYKMNHGRRGHFVIINNRNFHVNTEMADRRGTDVDAAQLYQCFKVLGFDVELVTNQSCRDMLHIMQQAANYDHSDADCFACAILSHGDEKGTIYGTDGIMNFDLLLEPFKGDKCRGLAGKPKLFFIQACRGNQLDHGADVADSDDGDKTNMYRIPSEADFLLAYSTTPGYFSWRNSAKGSWFVQAVCKAMKEYSDMEIMRLLTRVNHMVAYEYESASANEYMNHKKQVPSIVTMLTKELYFNQK